MKSVWILGLAALMASGCFVRRSSEPRAEVMDLENDPSATIEPLTPMPTAPVAPVAPPPTDAAPAEAGARKHVVAPGDTLYSLSVRYYGEGKHWTRIRDANPGLTPERMPLGKSITIP